MEPITEDLNKIQERLLSLQKKMPKEQESHHYNCDTCKDKGFIFGEVNGYEVASKCKCKVKEEIANKANRSGLADLFKTKTFENYETKENFQKTIKSKAMDYV